MDLLKAGLLGLAQGLTEFLPVSSSGHLVLGQKLLGLTESNLLFDVAVHAGTLVAVLVFFRSDIMAILRGLLPSPQGSGPGRKLLLLVIAGSIPTAALGLFFKDFFEGLFASTLAVGLALMVTGGLLIATRKLSPGARGVEKAGIWRAMLVGLAQGMAITPGISRSGATICTGLFLGFEREFAARFSFVLSIPAIMGALALEIIKIKSLAAQPWGAMIFGAAVAGLTGYLALKLLVGLVKKGSLHYFAYYCWALGLLAIGWGLF